MNDLVLSVDPDEPGSFIVPECGFVAPENATFMYWYWINEENGNPIVVNPGEEWYVDNHNCWCFITCGNLFNH